MLDKGDVLDSEYNNKSLEIDPNKIDYYSNIKIANEDKLGLTSEDTFRRQTNQRNETFRRSLLLQ